MPIHTSVVSLTLRSLYLYLENDGLFLKVLQETENRIDIMYRMWNKINPHKFIMTGIDWQEKLYRK